MYVRFLFIYSYVLFNDSRSISECIASDAIMIAEQLILKDTKRNGRGLAWGTIRTLAWGTGVNYESISQDNWCSGHDSIDAPHDKLKASLLQPIGSPCVCVCLCVCVAQMRKVHLHLPRPKKCTWKANFWHLGRITDYSHWKKLAFFLEWVENLLK
jgi:hypothetical protein